MDINLIWQFINLVPKIQAALAQGGNVLAIIQRLAPDLLPLIQQLGVQFFPTVDPAKAVQAGVDVVFNSDGTMWVQNNLNAYNKNTALAVDGKYGDGTKAAVSAYQTAHGLKVDGWCGPKTSGSLAVEVSKLTA